MSNKIKERMKVAFTNLLMVVHTMISRDLAQGINIELCLSAYNYYQEQERDGIGYIFDMDNPNDLKYLVEHEMITASGIAKIMSQNSHYFTFSGECDKGVEILSKSDIVEILRANARDYMECAMMYVGRCGEDSPYANIYEEYITSCMEEILNDQ